MSHELDPRVGRWYRRLDDEQLFKVVSIDEDDGLIEIKTFDGKVEELDSSEWVELDLENAATPEDYIEPDEDEDEELDEDRSVRGLAARDDLDDDEDDWDEDEDDDDTDDEDYDSDR